MRVLKPEDFGSDFKENCARLADALGVEDLPSLPRRAFRIEIAGKESLNVPTTRGRFASAAFLNFFLGRHEGHLGRCKRVAFSMATDADRQRLHTLTRAFFSPFLGDPTEKHPVIHALLDKQILSITEVAAEDVGPGYLLSWYENWKKLDAEAKEFNVPMAAKALLKLLEYGAEHPIECDDNGNWKVRPHVKAGILLYFRTHPNLFIGSEKGGPAYDKVPLLWKDWAMKEFEACDFRIVPGAIVRAGVHIEKDVILMPSFVNIGASVGEGSLIDTWATVGSCAQIGKKVHISGGAGIGGVLEPVQAAPVVVEDDVFIGARSEVAEGVIVRKRAVLSMGVFIGKNTPIVDRTKDGQITKGEIPENAVVMMGVHPTNGLLCPQIVKYRDEKTDAATALEGVLREAFAVS
jgi:2,3,4,5-tetrahydropyridine-2-carboxylate N-succinyltransferase